MESLVHSPSWQALAAHHQKIAPVHMRDLFAQDPARSEKFSVRFDDLLFDYSKNRITEETISLLIALAEQRRLPGWIEKMFSGEKINNTEKRAVLHTALRNRTGQPVMVDGRNVMPAIAL